MRVSVASAEGVHVRRRDQRVLAPNHVAMRGRFNRHTRGERLEHDIRASSVGALDDIAGTAALDSGSVDYDADDLSLPAI